MSAFASPHRRAGFRASRPLSSARTYCDPAHQRTSSPKHVVPTSVSRRACAHGCKRERADQPTHAQPCQRRKVLVRKIVGAQSRVCVRSTARARTSTLARSTERSLPRFAERSVETAAKGNGGRATKLPPEWFPALIEAKGIEDPRVGRRAARLIHVYPLSTRGDDRPYFPAATGSLLRGRVPCRLSCVDERVERAIAAVHEKRTKDDEQHGVEASRHVAFLSGRASASELRVGQSPWPAAAHENCELFRIPARQPRSRS